MLLHCPNHNLILCIKTEFTTAREDATVYSISGFDPETGTYSYIGCICSNRLGLYAEFQIILLGQCEYCTQNTHDKMRLNVIEPTICVNIYYQYIYYCY